MNDYSEYIGKHFLLPGKYCFISTENFKNNIRLKCIPFCGKIESIEEIDKNSILIAYIHNPPYKEKDSLIVEKSNFMNHCILADTEDETFTIYRLSLEVD